MFLSKDKMLEVKCSGNINWLDDALRKCKQRLQGNKAVIDGQLLLMFRNRQINYAKELDIRQAGKAQTKPT